MQGCVNYFIRYAGRPAMAENRITEYNKESNTVSWFYNDHKDEKRYDVTDNVIDSFNRDPIQCKCGAIMQYTYTYNPFKDKRNDRTYRKRCIDGMMRMYKRRI
ncbi:transposase [Holdemanella porci]|uniref:transposase n=1 Tax=Holdemanella porci TaxID=2652276 RepID=UPI003A5222A5